MSDSEFDPFIASIARELKEPVRLDARFDERVMAALEPEVISITSRRVATPWYRRRVSVSAPMVGLAAAAAFGGIAAVGVLASKTAAPVEVAQAPQGALMPAADRPVDTANDIQQIQFIYVAPEAQSVALVGDFNDWQPTPMVRDSANGGWTVTVPLAVGRYQYQFVLDGTRHVTDPAATMTSGDFGSPNSVVAVSPRP